MSCNTGHIDFEFTQAKAKLFCCSSCGKIIKRKGLDALNLPDISTPVRKTRSILEVGKSALINNTEFYISGRYQFIQPIGIINVWLLLDAKAFAPYYVYQTDNQLFLCEQSVNKTVTVKQSGKVCGEVAIKEDSIITFIDHLWTYNDVRIEGEVWNLSLLTSKYNVIQVSNNNDVVGFGYFHQNINSEFYLGETVKSYVPLIQDLAETPQV